MVDFLLKDADSTELDKIYEQAVNATDEAGNKKYTPEQLKQLKANLDKVVDNPRQGFTDAELSGMPAWKAAKIRKHYSMRGGTNKPDWQRKQDALRFEHVPPNRHGVDTDGADRLRYDREDFHYQLRRGFRGGKEHVYWDNKRMEGKTLEEMYDEIRKHEKRLHEASRGERGNPNWQPPPEETPEEKRNLDIMEASATRIKNRNDERARRYQPAPTPPPTTEERVEENEDFPGMSYGEIKNSLEKSVRKKSRRNAEDDSHQLGVGRRDGETGKLSSPAGSTIQAEHVGAVSKAILKQGLLDILLQKKEGIKALIPSAEEKDETQSELPELIGVDDDPHKGQISNVQAYNKSKKLKKAKKKGYSGKDPLEGEINETDDLHANADMGVMSYMAKTHFGSEPVSYDGDREARIKATRDHFQHLLLKTTCLCEKRGVVMAIGIKKSGNGSPLASAEKPVAVMAAEQSGLYSVDGKNLDLDPLANKAAMENVNQTDASTRSIDVTTDSKGRKTFHQKAEPTICNSKAVFNSILEKTYYDDQVLERYKNAGKDDKNKSKRRHITNDITDTAGQQSNKTRGI